MKISGPTTNIDYQINIREFDQHEKNGWRKFLPPPGSEPGPTPEQFRQAGDSIKDYFEQNRDRGITQEEMAKWEFSLNFHAFQMYARCDDTEKMQYFLQKAVEQFKAMGPEDLEELRKDYGPTVKPYLEATLIFLGNAKNKKEQLEKKLIEILKTPISNYPDSNVVFFAGRVHDMVKNPNATYDEVFRMPTTLPPLSDESEWTVANSRDEVQKYILVSLAKAEHIPAISVGKINSEGIIETHAIGSTNENSPQQVTEGTIFEAASLSKPVFAYIVLKMAERGEIDLDKPLHEICEFGPPLDTIRQHPNYKNLTARMLLSHQAGLPNEFEGEPAFLSDVNVGENFNYSGEAFRFLMDVVEQIKKPKKLEDIAQEEFKAIGMQNSSFWKPKTENIAVGHHKDGSVDTRQHFFWIHPAGTLHTTAEDYAKFMRACVNDEFIKRELFKPLVGLTGKDTKAIDSNVSEKVLNQISWGCGIGLQKSQDGGLIAFHWGDGSGTCRNFAAINLTTNQAVACFTNSANGPAVFRGICEPIVGDLTPVSQWLSLREKLPMKLQSEATKTDEEQRSKPFSPLMKAHKEKYRQTSSTGMHTEISDREMAESAFGQGSNTAKNIKKNR